MKIRRNSLKKAALCLLIAFLTVLAGVSMQEFVKTSSDLSKKSSDVLEVAVREFINSYMASEKSSYYSNSFNRKIGEYETRTFKSSDTVFTYNSRIVDIETDMRRAFQNGLLTIGLLQPEPIHAIFDSLLLIEGIYNTQSAIGITSSFYKKTDEWSGDTTALFITHRASLLHQGEFEDINYYAYIDCSFLTYWELMHKTGIYILLGLCVATGLFFLFWRAKNALNDRRGIALLEDGRYRLGNTFINLEECKAFSAKEIVVVLTPQQVRLLSLFLESESHRVAKETITQKLWPMHTSSDNVMTTAIKRVKDILKAIRCPYTIVSESNNFYLLTRCSKRG